MPNLAPETPDDPFGHMAHLPHPDDEAPTPEPFAPVPPDLMDAINHLVMLYGPTAVRLAAERC